ncbi:MAG TPA: DUF6600 domain-containing protein [Candidatus Elarobacter sp.]|jgi:hypothetical protein|nr:DUF6600 domain-containing protein [Candidatus Elarobacter sp.]
MHLSLPWRRPVLRAASAQALLVAAAVLVLPLAAPLAARADGDDQSQAGVARISIIDGSVAVQRGDSSAPIDAAVNAPVLAADYITTGDASHAEVQFDGTSMLRLGDNVQMRFTRIDTGNRQLQLAQGTVELRLLQGADGENVIDTPSVSLHPLDTGAYRVTVDGDGRTTITIRAGQAELITPQGNQTIGAGTAVVADGPASSPSVQNVQAVAMDDFDQFNQNCDQRESSALASTPNVDQSVSGVADLDANGQWQQDPSYGQVWVPTTVAADWAPYRDGSWVWEGSYGWTWVGYEPWGWAPYHYGRWFHSAAYGWAWYPGPRGFSAWSPALVAFVGFGGGGGVALGFGNIGWVPLAPFEPFNPWWGRGAGLAFNGRQNYVYRNALYNGATYVSHERFLQGRFDHASPMTLAQVRGGEIVHGSPVAPTRENLRFNDRPAPANLAVRTSAFTSRSFAGRSAVVERTPFEQQRAGFTGASTARPNVSSQGGAWSRFSSERPSYNAERPTYNQGTNAYQRPNTTERSTYNQGTNGYQRPNTTTERSTYNQGTNGYQRPNTTTERSTYNQGTNGYQRPNTTTERSTYNQGTNTYQRPSYAQGSNTYQRPSYAQGSNAYQRPSYTQGSNTYQRPSYTQGSNAYQRPSYTQGSNAYQRPSYNQGSSYQRSYNQGSSYQRPAYNQRSYGQGSGSYRQPQSNARSLPPRQQQSSGSGSNHERH